MAGEDFKPLSEAEVAAIDVRYVPFPAFEDWPEEVPREELWSRDYDKFVEISAVASEEDLQRAQQIALRTAAFDTGAIEGLYPTDRGLTFTVATQASAWEQEVESRDAGALELFKAQLAAFELILDLSADRFPELTQTWIRRLHEEVTAAQEVYVVHTPIGAQEQPLPRGKYKEHPNHVRTSDGEIHAYAPVDQTQSEMQRLVDELNSQKFKEAHPILQASYAHYAVAAIHPFADGNGRVARAVASAYTYRAATVPLLVLAHHREPYFAALGEADSGNAAPFIEFIARVARDGLEMVTERLKAARAPQPEQIVDEFKDLFLAQGDLTHRQLDEVANELIEVLRQAVDEQVSTLNLPDGIRISASAASGENRSDPPEGFRSVISPSGRFVDLRLRASAPGRAGERVFFDVFVSTESDTASSVVVQVGRAEDQLVFGLADLYPQISSAARLRLNSLIQRTIGNALNHLLQAAREQLRESGY